MESIGSRIALARKELKLTQKVFSQRIGVARNTVASYETGAQEPLPALTLSMCREFNINEDWLRTGEGKMFIDFPEEDEYFKAAAELSKTGDELAMRILVEYWKLDNEKKLMFKEFIYNIADQSRNKE